MEFCYLRALRSQVQQARIEMTGRSPARREAYDVRSTEAYLTNPISSIPNLRRRNVRPNLVKPPPPTHISLENGAQEDAPA